MAIGINVSTGRPVQYHSCYRTKRFRDFPCASLISMCFCRVKCCSTFPYANEIWNSSKGKCTVSESMLFRPNSKIDSRIFAALLLYLESATSVAVQRQHDHKQPASLLTQMKHQIHRFSMAASSHQHEGQWIPTHCLRLTPEFWCTPQAWTGWVGLDQTKITDFLELATSMFTFTWWAGCCCGFSRAQSHVIQTRIDLRHFTRALLVHALNSTGFARSYHSIW